MKHLVTTSYQYSLVYKCVICGAISSPITEMLDQLGSPYTSPEKAKPFRDRICHMVDGFEDQEYKDMLVWVGANGDALFNKIVTIWKNNFPGLKFIDFLHQTGVLRESKSSY